MTHYHELPTDLLQRRREILLSLPRAHTDDERGELQAIERELQARNVLSIGIAF